MLCRSQGALWQGSPASLQSPGTASAEPGLCPALWATQVPLRTHRNTVCSVQPHSKRLEGTSRHERRGRKRGKALAQLLATFLPPGRRDAQVQAQGACNWPCLLTSYWPAIHDRDRGTEATFSPLWHKYSQTRASENGKYSFCQRSQWVKTPGAAQQGCL